MLTDGRLAKADAATRPGDVHQALRRVPQDVRRGANVGPELTGSQRANLDYVLENVLDPSAVVPTSIQLINFTTDGRRVVVGHRPPRDEGRGDGAHHERDGRRSRPPTSPARKQTNVSIMPEGCSTR